MKDPGFFIEYHLWAHHKVLQSLTDLSEEEWNRNTGGSFASLKALYQHIVVADYRWLQRWKGVPFADIPEDFVVRDYATLNTILRPVLEEILTVSATFIANDAEKPVNFITVKGLDITQPFWQTVLQLVNHGTYHRGQVAYVLRTLGREPVSTDIFLFFRERHQSPPAMARNIK
jgi:uncharacterized damage-inducible protein DinB